ncbi:DUF1573 domain-containing protein [Rasiella sp. SM2506]|uniref:DUF1573 domain-containing protein n=1 Tax=Rasiella sp. SM2506 TaxID=3423914 RepID=UPI003D79FEC3
MKLKLNTVKKGAILCFLFVVTAPLSYAQMARENIPAAIGIIDFKTETVAYGTIAQNSDGQRTITFKNTGDAPLLITDVKSSCGCTVPSYSKTPVMPNESGKITVKYNTSKIGAFNKTITVLSNASAASKQIKIKGEVTKGSSL